MRAIATATALLLAGCPADPPSATGCDCAQAWGQDPILEVGAGSPDGPTVEPIAEGAELLLHYGSQGGYHVYLGFRTQGICASGVRLVRILRVAGDDLEHRTMLATPRMTAGPEGEAGWWAVSRAAPTFICPPTQPGQVMYGVPLEVEATMTESDACADPEAGPRSATARVTFVAVCPDGDETCLTDDVVGCDVWEG